MCDRACAFGYPCDGVNEMTEDFKEYNEDVSNTLWRDSNDDEIEQLRQRVQEPDAWRTFDGEGGYDYRSFVDNEKYQAEFLARNPNSTYKNWVEPLYLHPLPPDDVVRDPRVAELEAALRECREALVMNIVGTGGRTPAAHEAIAKIDKVLK